MDAPDLSSANVHGTSQPSSYIRTFAKDFQMLSGKAPEPSSKNTPRSKSLFSKKQRVSKTAGAAKPNDSLITTSSDQQAPQDLSVLETHAEEESTKAFAVQDTSPDTAVEEIPEPISLPRIDPGDIVQQTPKPVPVEPPHTYVAPKPQAFVSPTRAPAIASIPPAPIPTPPGIVVPKDTEREAVLARLKARVASHTGATPEAGAKPIPPTPPTPVSIPLPQAAPRPIPAAPPPIENSPEALHTYKTDFADHLEEKGGSAFSVLAAEKDAPRAKPARRKSTLMPRILVLLGAFVFIVAGGGSVYEAYVFMTKTAAIPVISAPTTLINPDSSVALSGSGQTLLAALAQEAAQPLALNRIINTYVNVSTTTSQGQIEEQGTGGAFISELNLPAPDILLRNIDPSSMVGVVNVGGETRPFFILRVTSYERTFSGMLAWEPTMYSALATLYPVYPAPTPQAASVIASSTLATSTVTSLQAQATSSQIFIPPSSTNQSQPSAQFTDEIVANHSTRVLTDLAGRTLLIYGYVDKQTLIIARNEAAFTYLLSRLQQNASN